MALFRRSRAAIIAVSLFAGLLTVWNVAHFSAQPASLLGDRMQQGFPRWGQNRDGVSTMDTNPLDHSLWRQDTQAPFLPHVSIYTGRGVDRKSPSLENVRLLLRIPKTFRARPWTGGYFVSDLEGPQMRFLYRTDHSILVVPPMSHAVGSFSDEAATFLTGFLKRGSNAIMVLGSYQGVFFVNDNIALEDGSALSLKAVPAVGPFELQDNVLGTIWERAPMALPCPDDKGCVGVSLESLPQQAIVLYATLHSASVFAIPLGNAGIILYVGFDFDSSFSEVPPAWARVLEIAKQYITQMTSSSPKVHLLGYTAYMQQKAADAKMVRTARTRYVKFLKQANIARKSSKTRNQKARNVSARKSSGSKNQARNRAPPAKSAKQQARKEARRQLRKEYKKEYKAAVAAQKAARERARRALKYAEQQAALKASIKKEQKIAARKAARAEAKRQAKQRAIEAKKARARAARDAAKLQSQQRAKEAKKIRAKAAQEEAKRRAAKLAKDAKRAQAKAARDAKRLAQKRAKEARKAAEKKARDKARRLAKRAKDLKKAQAKEARSKKSASAKASGSKNAAAQTETHVELDQLRARFSQLHSQAYRFRELASSHFADAQSSLGKGDRSAAASWAQLFDAAANRARESSLMATTVSKQIVHHSISAVAKQRKAFYAARDARRTALHQLTKARALLSRGFFDRKMGSPVRRAVQLNYLFIFDSLFLRLISRGYGLPWPNTGLNSGSRRTTTLRRVEACCQFNGCPPFPLSTN